MDPSAEAVDLTRCRMAVATVVRGGVTAFEDAIALVRQLPQSLPERGSLAADVVVALVNAGAEHGLGTIWLRHMNDLIAIADRCPPPGSLWPRIRPVARAQSLLYAAGQGQLHDIDAALAEIDAFDLGDDPAVRLGVGSARAGLAFLRAQRDGDFGALRRVREDVAALGDGLTGVPAVAELHAFIMNMVDAAAASQTGDQATRREVLDQLATNLDHLSRIDGMREAVADTAPMIESMRSALDAEDRPPSRPSDAGLAGLIAATLRPGATAADRAFAHVNVTMCALNAGTETDVARVDLGIHHGRQAVASCSDDDTRRSFYLSTLALALMQRADITATVDGLDEAVDLLRQAKDSMGGPHHPHWTYVNDMLRGGLERLGRDQDAQESTRDALRGFAVRALLESDAVGLPTAVREAADTAVDAARRFARDNRPADALTAIDAGRALMLFAAVTRRDFASQLDGTDRRTVWEALSSGPGNLREMTEPRELSEIQAALAALDADALVYLVPAEPPLPGWALIAPVDGPAGFVALPYLNLTEDLVVDRYLRALTRDLDASGHDELTGSTDRMCDWAWRAAVGPLLEQYVDGRQWSSTGRRDRRIVLVPIGDLARIPWQAARRSDGVYAVELAGFSLVASARMLCDSAARTQVPLSQAGLLVGDPDTGGRAPDLEAARREAYAIRGAFYPGARYLGRLPKGSESSTGAGTAGQVRAWLTDRRPQAGTMIHLACHGDYRTDPAQAKSYLLLASDTDADGPGELSAAELVELMASAEGRDVSLVVLAACNTGRSIYGYDEAFSLATAFLAGGARTVLSTQWSVPDEATSSLMFMFHYYLRHEHLPPWQALRQAQLWLLHPQRRKPLELPAGVVAPTADDVPAPVVAWAGFVHWGH
ncbi:CHAT domain-containing protein [Luedemannella helvata]|uniref:CHAT domain-containing protein n=1 Tax=Luedemannella helvata TaxID=349315 RepID=A0ABN2L4S3_9ACTN